MPHKITEEDSMMEKKVKEKYTGPRVTDTETFIQKARWVHGDKYDYSKVEYINDRTKVKIICTEHATFLQTPSNHLSGRGCLICSGRRKKSWSEHLKDFREVHGDKYEYSENQILDKANRTKIRIVCKLHGQFVQTINNHASGKGCIKCGGRSKHTTDSFIRKSREVHGDFYDYSKVDYVNKETEVCIICPDHKEFYQRAGSHVRGSGCPKCSSKRVWELRKHEKNTTENFIRKANEIHVGVYDYSLAKCFKSTDTVEIICDFHGKFHQRVADHLRGSGCSKCAGQNLSVKEWVERFMHVHGNLYDYSKVRRVNSGTKIEIICKTHGSFYKTPIKHLYGQGCPCCAKDNREYNPMSAYGIRGYYGTVKPSNLYVLKLNDSFMKVGLAKEIHSRMGKLNKESGYSVEKLYSISGKANELFELEQKILRISNLKRFYPDVTFDGQSECLELSELPKVLQIIEEWEKEQKFEEDA